MAIRQYRFTSTLTEDDFVAYMAAFNRYNAYSGGMQKLSRIAFRVSGAFMMVTGLLNLVLSFYQTFVLHESATATAWVSGVGFLIAGALVWLSQNADQAGRSLWKRYDNKGQPEVVRFSPNHYKKGDEKLEYSSVSAVYEDGSHYYLFRGRRQADILRKDGIDELGLEGFDKFLEEKTDRVIRTVK